MIEFIILLATKYSTFFRWCIFLILSVFIIVLGVIKMAKKIELDPVFKIFSFGSQSAYLFETIAVHPEGYLYLEPVLAENSFTLDHSASSGLTRFDSAYLYRTLSRTPDAGRSSDLGIGILFYPTPDARIDSEHYQEIYEVFKSDVNDYLATDGLPGIVGCNISNQDYQKTLNLLNVYVNEITEVCVEAKNVLVANIHADKPNLKIKTSEKIARYLKSIDWLELTKIVKDMIKVVLKN